MTEPTGEYSRDARLIFFQLDQLTDHIRDVDRRIAAELGARAESEAKQRQDLDVAHERIRELQRTAGRARLKAWAATGAASFLSVVVIELLKYILR